MFKRRWLNILLLVIGTNIATAALTSQYWLTQISNYFNTEVEPDKNRYSTEPKKTHPYANIDMGLMIPEKLLIDDEEKNWNFAEMFLSEKYSWARLKSGYVPGLSGRKGYSFKLLDSP